MEKTRLLFVTNHLFVGGVDKVAVDIVNGLDKDRFDVTLLVLFRYDPGRYHIDPRVHVQPVFKTYFKGPVPSGIAVVADMAVPAAGARRI